MSSKKNLLCLTHSVYMKYENSYVFAKTKPQSVITTALQ